MGTTPNLPTTNPSHPSRGQLVGLNGAGFCFLESAFFEATRGTWEMKGTKRTSWWLEGGQGARELGVSESAFEEGAFGSCKDMAAKGPRLGEPTSFHQMSALVGIPVTLCSWLSLFFPLGPDIQW